MNFVLVKASLLHLIFFSSLLFSFRAMHASNFQPSIVVLSWEKEMGEGGEIASYMARKLGR